MGNWTKVFQHSMSRYNITNSDKPKLVNYNCKICNTEIFEVQNFGRENFDNSTCIRQNSSDFSTVKVLRYTVQKIRPTKTVLVS